jgi:hypothetical protein
MTFSMYDWPWLGNIDQSADMSMKRLWSTAKAVTPQKISNSGSISHPPRFPLKIARDQLNMLTVCSGPKMAMANSAYVFPAGPSQELEGERGASFLLKHSFLKVWTIPADQREIKSLAN